MRAQISRNFSLNFEFFSATKQYGPKMSQSQGQPGPVPGTSRKRDKMASLLLNQTENSRFVPRTGPGLSQERVLFVPDTIPPKCLCLLVFLARFTDFIFIHRLFLQKGGFFAAFTHSLAHSPHSSKYMHLITRNQDHVAQAPTRPGELCGMGWG